MTFVLSLLRVVPPLVWVVVACLAWGGWQRHRAISATKAAAVAEQRAAVEAATSEAERKAREQEQTYADNARTAADTYAANLKRARASGDAARRELNVLFDLVASPASPGGAASGAVPGRGADDTAALRVVVGECAAALSQVAEVADDREAHVKGLQDYIRAIGAAKDKR